MSKTATNCCDSSDSQGQPEYHYEHSAHHPPSLSHKPLHTPPPDMDVALQCKQQVSQQSLVHG